MKINEPIILSRDCMMRLKNPGCTCFAKQDGFEDVKLLKEVLK